MVGVGAWAPRCWSGVRRRHVGSLAHHQCSRPCRLSPFALLSARLSRPSFGPLPGPTTQAATEFNFVNHRDLQELVLKKHCGIAASQAVEDSFNFMKNGRKQKGKNKFRKPTKVFSSVLSAEVMSRVHKYKEVDVDRRPFQLSATIPKEVFQPGRSSASIPVQKLVGTNTSTPWHSPGPDNFSIGAADLALIEWAHRTNRWGDLQTAWLCTLVRPKHNIVLIEKASGSSWFALRSWPDSCVLAFVAVKGTLPTGEDFYEADLSMTEPQLLPFVKLDEWEAIHYTWRAPSWQVARVAAAGQSLALRPALRAFSSSGRGPEPIDRVAARQGYWSIEKATLVKLAGHLGVMTSTGDSLVDLLVRLIKHSVPGTSAEDAVLLCKTRLALYAQASQWSEDILQIDDAMLVLDRNDEQHVRSQKKAAASTQEEASTFRAQYTAKLKEARTSDPQPKKKKQRGAAGAAEEKPPKYPKRVPSFPDAGIDLVLARALVPAGGALWKDQKFGSWQGHYPPFPRIGRSWRKYTEREALRLVLENLWGWHLLEKGLQPADCPISGIFVAGTSGSASSSSGGVAMRGTT